MPTRGDIESDTDQDEEWCEVRINGTSRRIRFHDYDEIYAIPGLYEQLFYEELRCVSPRTVCSMLGEVVGSNGSAHKLRVLDVGAGNGMVGEQLKELGAESIVGVDIIPEAAEATERDRSGVYDDYLVMDLTDIGEPEDRLLRGHRLNALTCVAALGFDDIPPAVFAAAFDYLDEGGMIGICIKDTFMDEDDPSGFAGMIEGALDDGVLELRAKRRYQHRLSAAGEPLHYVALVAQKRGELPSQ